MVQKQIFTAVRALAVLSLLTGLLYPLLVTGVAQVLFPWRANGSLILSSETVIGSELIGQRFSDPKYFWPRPSAVDYQALPSSGSNLGPTSQVLSAQVRQRENELRAQNGLSPETPLPADLLFASGSGLDPHISPAAARLQIERISGERGLEPEQLAALVEAQIEPPQLGFLGEPRVNVLLLNLALDRLK
jgi:K+-transporting ATPase ATPase C chain